MLISGLLRRALTPVVKTGRLAFAFVGGDSFELGDGSGPLVKARFTDTGAPLALLLDPDLMTGELFTDSRLVIDQGSVYDFLELVLRHGDEAPPSASADLLDRLRDAVRRLS